MKINFNSDDELPLNKTIKAKKKIHKNNKYYAQVLLDECLFKI